MFWKRKDDEKDGKEITEELMDVISYRNNRFIQKCVKYV